MRSALLVALAAAACSSESKAPPVVSKPTPLTIDGTSALPGQVTPGGAVTLSWRTTGAVRATLSAGAAGAATDVPVTGSQVVRPATTTVFTLTAYAGEGGTPSTLTRTMTARVAPPPSVSSFVATPSSIVQGESSTLTWVGNAASYRVSDGTTTFTLGQRRSLVVRPAATTTYQLLATGPGGDLPSPSQATVTVAPHPGSALVYTAPAAGALRLLADPCTAPCAAMTLRIVASAPVQLRGAALDLPLDRTKVTFDRNTFAAGAAFAGAPAAAAFGAGPLQDALALGVALEGSGSAPAADVALNAGDELAHFTLALDPAGGRGVVFDGFALAASPQSSYKAVVQSASGRAANAIAVGKLEAQ